jgi:DNA primase
VIPDDEVERVREAADIIAIIGEFVSLKRVGADFRGPCPFHQGTHRNFSVSPRRKIYHCFKCGEGGDVFTFLRKRLGVDWPTAVRMAAEKTGITLREVNQRRSGPDPRDPVWEVNGAAQEYFQRILWADPGGSAAREYLAQRDVTKEQADRFGLGFAPREIGLMRTFLTGLGYDDQRQLDAGLLVRREESDEPRPRFRGRLIFPIYDVGGRVAGFGGRLIAAGEPKYLNSGESVAFTKGKLLYGLNWAKNAIRRAERALLVEGYFDLVRLAVAGVEEVVAPLGTALTPDQAMLVTRYSKNVFLLYDSDRAGLRATFRAGDELLQQGASVRVVTLPQGEDPDSFVRQHGREGLERLLAGAVDVLERKIQLLQRGGWFGDLHRRRRAIDYLLPTIRAAADPVTRDMYLGRAAETSGVDRRVLGDEVTGTVAPTRTGPGGGTPAHGGGYARDTAARVPPRSPPAQAKVTGRLAAERKLVHAMVTVRPLIERVLESVGPAQLRDARLREIFEAMRRLGSDTPDAGVLAALSPDAAGVYETLLAEPEAIVDAERTISDCLSDLKRRDLQERNAEIQRLLGAATGSEKDRLIREKQDNAAEISRLSGSTVPI